MVMGIINCSYDSFYAATAKVDAALHRADSLVKAGADILDVGGEATNPFLTIEESSPDKAALQCESVLPVIEAIRSRFDVPMSIDTSEPLVMAEAVKAGVACINDQRSLQLPGAVEVAVEADVPAILMHSYLAGPPANKSGSIVERVKREWLDQLNKLAAQGLKKERVILDPGFGQGNFGKDLQDNCELMIHLPELVALGYPVLVGWSRKSMIRDLCGISIEECLPGSLAAAIVAVQKGASIIRVHDVAETKQALRVLEAID